MNAGRVHPREEQVAELTRGLILPLAPLDEIHLTFIVEELLKAWMTCKRDNSLLFLLAMRLK